GASAAMEAGLGAVVRTVAAAGNLENPAHTHAARAVSRHRAGFAVRARSARGAAAIDGRLGSVFDAVRARRRLTHVPLAPEALTIRAHVAGHPGDAAPATAATIGAPLGSALPH